MLPEMIKKAIRRAAIGAVGWARGYYVQGLEEESRRKAEAEQNYDRDDYIYPWLNSILTKLLREGGGTLRPHFAWGVLHGVHLAERIGIKRVSVIEFGVAGGNGLISLEKIAEWVEKFFGIGVDAYGFDTGAGLPKPEDYRDSPNLYTETAFAMDPEKLKKRLNRAQLITGLIQNTISDFIDSRPAPVAFISFDLDYYSSTIQAFKLLEADQSILLPRIHCYFDDIIGFTHSDYTGERLAISEFNESHNTRKISPIYGLKHFLPMPLAQGPWWEMFFMAHIFDHQLYGMNDGLVRSISGDSTELKDA